METVTRPATTRILGTAPLQQQLSFGELEVGGWGVEAKGYVRYFSMFDEQRALKNCEKCFELHLKSSFHSHDIQNLYFLLPLFLLLSVM